MVLLRRRRGGKNKKSVGYISRQSQSTGTSEGAKCPQAGQKRTFRKAGGGSRLLAPIPSGFY
jgi:hypothetical protein